jgi:hypothetical protein
MAPLGRFVLVVLATWRVTHLLAREDGPGDLLVRLRKVLGSGFLGSLMDCFNCMSLWVAAPLCLYIDRNPLKWLLIWLAVSGAACLLEKIVPDRHVVAEQLSQFEEGESQYGMLRTETRTAVESVGRSVKNDNA